jgi:polyphosphate glucokinase
MLFLGLGTGLGSSLIVDGIVEPMELGHLPYQKGTYESYVGNEALVKQGKKKWRHVGDVVARLIAALEPDEVVLGGGNAKELKELPPKCRLGDNRIAFLGGFRLCVEASQPSVSRSTGSVSGTQSTRKDNEHGSACGSSSQRPAVKRQAWKDLGPPL